MKFGTKDVNTQDFVSKYISYGIQNLKINSLEIQEAGTGTPRVIFNVESEPVKDDNFEGEEGALGRVGRIRSGWLKTESQQTEFLENIGKIADKIGKREEVDKIEAESLEKYLSEITPLICGHFARFKVTAEEYEKQDGNLGITLSFARFKFVEALEEDAKMTFDKTNQYDFKKLDEEEKTQVNSNGVTEEANNSLPF